jgi:hypothetical protein
MIVGGHESLECMQLEGDGMCIDRGGDHRPAIGAAPEGFIPLAVGGSDIPVGAMHGVTTELEDRLGRRRGRRGGDKPKRGAGR